MWGNFFSMQKDIHYYEKLIQEKRKKTPWRDFVKEIASWNTLSLYKQNSRVCRYPWTPRSPKLGDNFWEDSPMYTEDFNKDFFDAFIKLFKKIPFQYLLNFWGNENSNYSDLIFWGAKNSYLSFVIWYDAMNIAYSAYCYTNLRDIYNSFFSSVNNSNIYMSGGVTGSHKIYYSKYITDSNNIWFSTNLIGCEECILCDSLENQKYCIKNKPYSKDEYYEKKNELMKRKDVFTTLHQSILWCSSRNIGSEDVSWEYVIKSRNTKNAYWSVKIHNARNIVVSHGWDSSELFYDAVDTGINSDNLYAICGGGNGSHHLYCSSQTDTGSHLYYCLFMANSHHCLGCIWLKNKSYCILNKQYSKEEWEEKVCEIFASMEEDGTLGSFFPASMNPFYFNDTLAYLIDDTFTKEEVEADGYLWRDEPIRADIPEGMRVVKNTELDQFQGFRRLPVKGGADEGGGGFGTQSQNPPWSPLDRGVETWYIDPEVLNIVISDEKWNYYRIVKMEYDFLMKHWLPLPTMHWLDRMKMGFR